jgi:alpha-glucosidase (family GH31 glycosyl hydrolase)
LPIYVRAGAVLPTGPPRQYTNEPAAGPLTITVFPGAHGVGSVYEDDGESFDFRNGEFMRIEMQWEDTARKLGIRLASGARMLSANPKTFSIKVIDSNQARMVTFKGDPLSVAL